MKQGPENHCRDPTLDRTGALAKGIPARERDINNVHLIDGRSLGHGKSPHQTGRSDEANRSYDRHTK
jgi:hypothetical protein